MNKIQSRYLNWIVENSSNLSLVIEDRVDIKAVLPDYSNIKATMVIDGIEGVGFGTDASEDIALVKATIEAIERIVIKSSGQVTSSNGVAAHLLSDSAQNNARLELIERDDFFLHFFTKSKLIQLTENQYKDSLSKYSLITNYLNRRALELEFFLLRDGPSVFTTACIVRNYAGATVFCLGVGNCFNEAIESSLIQCLRKTVSVFPERLNGEAAQVFDSGCGPKLHLKEALGNGYYQIFRNHFSGQSLCNGLLGNEQIKVRPLTPLSSVVQNVLTNANVFCFYATSLFAQNIFFGHLKEDDFNSRKFSSLGITYEMVKDFLMHPMA